MYGDPFYELVASGSTAASANTAHLLFGTYQGLSQLNNDDVVHIIVEPGGSDLRLGLASTGISNNYGIPVYAAGSGFELPPMRSGTASQLLFANKNLGSNASPSWTIFRRIS